MGGHLHRHLKAAICKRHHFQHRWIETNGKLSSSTEDAEKLNKFSHKMFMKSTKIEKDTRCRIPNPDWQKEISYIAGTMLLCY